MEASEAPQEQRPGTKKTRSPAYPLISLELAVKRAKSLYNVAGKHPAHITSAMSAWGYGSKSSGGLQTVAALKQYGLATDSGSGGTRSVALTKLAQELLVYGGNTESDEWKARIRQAALKPKIHAELWEKYQGDLPADSVILPFLVLDRDFTDDAARTVLKQFREAIAFAGSMADAADTVSRDESDTESETPESDEAELVMPPTITPPTETPAKDPPAEKRREQRTIQVTYSPTEWALVQAKFPLSESDWDSMIAVLQAMKRGLVASDDDHS